MHISIVIPTRNRSDCLAQCLDAIGNAAAHAAVLFDIQVVDDGSDRRIQERNKSLCSAHGAAYHLLPKNRGMAVARNTAAGLCRGEWIGFIDDDVVVEADWFIELARHISAADEKTVGIEGFVKGLGDGVWDREVESLHGGLYLTCHIIYRSFVFRTAGGFDEHFEYEGPYHEDHELAARILQYGAIAFCPSLKAAHLPRQVKLLRYLADSPKRMRQSLNAEIYFYLKQRDRYHLFRHARSFWGTYRAIAMRYCITTFHRRSFVRLVRHPMQTGILAVATLIEQAVAWTMFPRLLRRFMNETVPVLSRSVNLETTFNHWHLCTADAIDALRLGRSFQQLAVFFLRRRPVYDICPVIDLIMRKSDPAPALRLFLRIDDVTPERAGYYDAFIAAMRETGISYLAAVSADDMLRPGSAAALQEIVSSGGKIGLHGFSHQGRFGAFDSELLQLRIPEIDERIQMVWRAYGSGPIRPLAFVPPFNAINAMQILHLATHFPIICSGPETARFTERLIGPLVLKNGSIFFPSFFPFYNDSATILAGFQLLRRRLCGDICMTVHMPQERAGGFTALRRLCDGIREHVRPWSMLPFEKEHPV